MFRLSLLWQFFRFHRYRLRFAFPIRNSYPTDIPRKVSLNCQGSAIVPVADAEIVPSAAILTFWPAAKSLRRSDAGISIGVPWLQITRSASVARSDIAGNPA